MSADVYDLLKIAAEELIAQNTELKSELAEAREQNAKLVSIAERAIDDLRWFFEPPCDDDIILELDQLKEGAK